MFLHHAEVLDDSKVIRYRMMENGSILTWNQVLMLWQSNSDFQAYYSELLATNRFEAYFWEHPPITRHALNGPYEFVLVNSPALASVSANTASFEQYFQEDEWISVFKNLGGDSTLISPRPARAQNEYPHLAVFVRQAPREQQHALWQAIGKTLVRQATDAPIWLSTSGLGVYWLHVRLDQRPKYYVHRAYKQA